MCNCDAGIMNFRKKKSRKTFHEKMKQMKNHYGTSDAGITHMIKNSETVIFARNVSDTIIEICTYAYNSLTIRN